MARTSEPTVAIGTARDEERTWPAITGTISKPWQAKTTMRAARSQPESGAAAAGAGKRPQARAKAPTSSTSGRSLRTVRLVQTRAESRRPDATTAARSVTRSAGAALEARPAAEAEGGQRRARQAHHHRGGAEERADVRDPAHEERHAVAEGGAGEDDGPAVLVEAAAEGREGERRRQQRQAGEREDGHRAEPGRAGRDRRRDEEDADADDAVEPERQELEWRRPAGPLRGRGACAGEFTTRRERRQSLAASAGGGL